MVYCISFRKQMKILVYLWMCNDNISIKTWVKSNSSMMFLLIYTGLKNQFSLIILSCSFALSYFLPPSYLAPFATVFIRQQSGKLKEGSNAHSLL